MGKRLSCWLTSKEGEKEGKYGKKRGEKGGKLAELRRYASEQKAEASRFMPERKELQRYVWFSLSFYWVRAVARNPKSARI